MIRLRRVLACTLFISFVSFSSRQEDFLQNLLDRRFFFLIIVNTMNKVAAESIDTLLAYQTRRLQDLIAEILQCCKQRTSYLSERSNVPEAELRCLLLFSGERYLTAKGIAQRLEVAKSRVTKIINGLIQKGLVETMDDPKDARIKLIGLTPEGQKRAEDIGALSRELHQRLLLEFDQEQRKTVLSCLEMLRSSMEAVKKQEM
jgi:DNA-binding MarR family transcriptional regulator